MAKITSNNLDRDKVEGVKTRDLSDAQLQEFAQLDAALYTTPVVKTGGRGRLGVYHWFQRGFDARPGFALPGPGYSRFSGGGPHRPVRLCRKRGR